MTSPVEVMGNSQAGLLRLVPAANFLEVRSEEAIVREEWCINFRLIMMALGMKPYSIASTLRPKATAWHGAWSWTPRRICMALLRTEGPVVQARFLSCPPAIALSVFCTHWEEMYACFLAKQATSTLP